jgi:hypothetical protein
LNGEEKIPGRPEILPANILEPTPAEKAIRVYGEFAKINAV